MNTKIPDYCLGCTLWRMAEKERKLKEKAPLAIKSFKKIYKTWEELIKRGII